MFRLIIALIIATLMAPAPGLAKGCGIIDKSILSHLQAVPRRFPFQADIKEAA